MGDQTVFLIGLLVAILSVLIIFGGFFSYYFFFSRSVKKEEPEEEPFDKVDQKRMFEALRRLNIPEKWSKW